MNERQDPEMGPCRVSFETGDYFALTVIILRLPFSRVLKEATVSSLLCKGKVKIQTESCMGTGCRMLQ